MSHWRVLPDELEEHILGKLSLWELGRVSETSRTFQEVFTRRLDKELKARSDLALEQFGQERIASIAALVERCVKGETMDLAFGGRTSLSCWMSADGKLRVIEEEMPWVSCRARYEQGDVHVSIHTPMRVGDTSHTEIYITWGRTYSVVVLSSSQGESVTIEVSGCGDEDLQGVALVQVLLSGGHGPTFRYDGHPVKVHIKFRVLREADRKLGMYKQHAQLSEAGLQTQIAPLMPLAPQMSFNDGVVTLSFLWD